LFTAEQQSHRIGKWQPIELLHKVDSETALPAAVPEPLIASDGYTVMTLPPPLPAGACELLSLSSKKVNEINRVCTLLLFIGEVNISCQTIPPLSAFPLAQPAKISHPFLHRWLES